MSGLANGCCSAVSPCSHQRVNPNTICETCIPARALSAVGQKAGTERSDEIVTRLYRRFKEWAARGFGPDDVTWCEVKADIDRMIALIPAPSVAEAAEPVAWRYEHQFGVNERWHVFYSEKPIEGQTLYRNITPLYTHPAPSPVVPSGLEALVERARAIAEMARTAIDTGGREEFDPRGVEDDVNALADAIAAALNRIAEIEGETIERAVKAVAERRRLLNSQFEVIDIAREDAAYEIAIEAVRSSATKQEKAE